MHTLIEQAHAAFNQKNYTKAKQLYGLYLSREDKRINSMEEKIAFYMLTYLTIRQGDFSQALHYYHSIEDPSFKSEQLPKRLHDVESHWLITQGVLEIINRPYIHEIDLTGYPFTGDSFDELLSILKTKKKMTSLRLGKMPLTLDEVHALLDVLLTKHSLVDIDLTELPLDKKAWQKIKTLLAQADANAEQSSAMSDLFTLQLSGQATLTVSALPEFLATLQRRAVKLSVTAPGKEFIFLSAAVKDKAGTQKEELDNIVAHKDRYRAHFDNLKAQGNLSDQQLSATFVSAIRIQNPQPWYTDQEINLLLTHSIAQLGGYQTGHHFLLAGNQEGQFPDHNGKSYFVFLTPAVDTEQTASPLHYYFDKAVQPAPQARDDRLDIFDEMASLISFHQQANFKILFPYNRSQQHWLTGEISIEKIDHRYHLEMVAHDPYGGGIFVEENAVLLYQTIKKQLLHIDPQAKFSSRLLTSPYSARQPDTDHTSCGVVLAEDLIARINGEPLSLPDASPLDTMVLRQKHLQQIATLPQENVDRNAFLAYFDVPASRVVERKEHFVCNERGEPQLFIVEQDAHLICFTLNQAPLQLDRLRDFFPCQSLTVHAEGAPVVLDGDLQVAGEVNIHCDDFKAQSDSLIKCQLLSLQGKNENRFAGRLDVSQLQCEAELIYLGKTFSLSCSEAGEFASQTRSHFKGRQIHCSGGQLTHDILTFHSEQPLTLSKDATLTTNQLHLSSERNVGVLSQIKCAHLSVHAHSVIQVGKEANISAQMSRFEGEEITLDGRVNGERAEFKAEEKVAFTSSSALRVPTITVQAAKFKSKGSLQTHDLHYAGDQAKLSGQINKKKILQPAPLALLNEEEIPEKLNLVIKSKACKIDTHLAIDNVLSIESARLFYTSRGKITGHPQATVLPNQPPRRAEINCGEKLQLADGAKLSIPFPLKVNTNELCLHGTLESNSLLEVCIEGEGKIFDTGILRSEYVKLEGKRCWNSGHIKGQMVIAFDQFFINGICDYNFTEKLKRLQPCGTLSGKHISITTGFFFNVLGLVNAESTLQLASLLYINAGLVNYDTLTHSSIASLDLGFNLTTLQKAKGLAHLVKSVTQAVISNELQTRDGLKVMAKSYYNQIDGKAIATTGLSYTLQLASIGAQVLSICVPHVGIPALMILNCVNLLLQLVGNSSKLIQEVSQLRAKYKNNEPLCPRHYYPFILATKNLGVAGASALMTGLHLPHTLSHLSEQIHHSHGNFTSVLPSVAGLFAGSSTTQTLLSVEGPGVTVSGMTSTTSLAHWSFCHGDISAVSFDNSFFVNQDFCFDAAVMRNMNAHRYHEDRGVNVASIETLMAREAYVGGHQAIHTFAGHVDHFQQSGSSEVTQLGFTADDALVNGHFQGRSGGFQATHLQTGKHGWVDFSHMGVKIEQAEVVQGKLHFDHVVGGIEHLHTGETADIYLNHTGLKAGGAQVDGHVYLQQSVIESATPLQLGPKSNMELYEASVKGDIAQQAGSRFSAVKSLVDSHEAMFAGKAVLDRSELVGQRALVSGSLKAKETYIKEEKLNLKDESENLLKDCVIEADQFQKQAGSILAADNDYIKSTEATLDGVTQVTHQLMIAGESVQLGGEVKGEELIVLTSHLTRDGKIDIEKAVLEGSFTSQEINQLLTDQNFKANEVAIATDNNISLGKVTSSQNVTIVATSIIDEAPQNLQSFHLQSTVGDTVINGELFIKGQFTAYAEATLRVNASVHGDEVALFGKQKLVCSGSQSRPQRRHLLFGHRSRAQSKSTSSTPQKTTVNGKRVYLGSEGDIFLAPGQKKSAFTHFSPFSSGAKWQADYGVHIHGDYVGVKANNLYNNGQTMTAGVMIIDLKGSLYNSNQGVIAATHLLSIEAQNVVNRCKKDQQGTYEAYTPSFIIGGDGVESEGVGLYIHTTNQIHQDASYIMSTGSNVLLADGGFESLARSSTRTVFEEDKSSWFGLCQEHTEIKETVITESGVISSHGQNIIQCKSGKLSAVATVFSAAQGTHLSAKDGIKCQGLVGSVEISHSKNNGCFHDNEHRYDEFSASTQIIDATGIDLRTAGNTELHDTVISTPGHFHNESKHFSSDATKLQHSYERDSFGMSGTICNQQVFSVNNPSDFSQPIWGGDPTVCQVQQLAHSNGAAETVLNTTSLGINLANTGNAMLNGLRTHTLPTEVLKHELPAVFAPQLGINLTHSHTQSHSESLGDAGIFVGSADFQVQETIKIKGAPMQVAKDLFIDCQTLIVEGEQLHSTVDQKTQNVNFTVSSTGDPYQVGVSSSHCHSESTTAVTNLIQVGGTTHAHVDNVILNNAVIDTKDIAGQMGTLTVISQASDTQSKSQSFGISTGGDFNFSQQHCESHLVEKTAGIHVHNSINEKSKDFVVGTFDSTGGSITSDGVNNFKADTVHAKSVEEYAHSSGFGISGNVKNFKQDTQTNHLLAPDNQSAAITTTNLNFSNSHYKAENQTVLYGAQGTQVDVKQTYGDVVTDSSDGKKVTENSAHSYNVVIPHMTEETKEQFKKNGKWVAAFFKPKEDEAGSTSYYRNYGCHYTENKAQAGTEVEAGQVKEEDTVTEMDTPCYQDGEDQNAGGDENSTSSSPQDLREAYARGKVAGLTGKIPDDIDTWPSEMQGNFYLGMGESKGTTYGSLLGGAIVAVGVLAISSPAFLSGLMGCIEAVSENALSLTLRVTAIGTGAFRFFKAALPSSQMSEKEKFIELIKEYLGEGFTVLKPGAGKSDLILTSADKTKQIRFDIINSHGKDPHINIQTFRPRNKHKGDEKMVEIENIHVYPKGTLKQENQRDVTNKPKF